MSGLPDLVPWIVGTLLATTLLSMARLAANRRWLLLSLQPLLIGTLAVALLWTPPLPPRPLILLTDGADEVDVATLREHHPEARLAALPGAPSIRAARQATDLRAALRAAPTSRLLVVGHGLEPSELAEIGDLHLSFHPPADSPPVIASLRPPEPTAPGQRWQVGGHLLHATPSLQLALLDPAGAVIDTALPQSDGSFRLQAATPLAGALRYAVALQDGERELQRLPLSVVTAEPPAPRGLLLAATPSPELKFLRRWAADAGITLDARIGLSPGLAVQQGSVALDATRLEALDLLIVDTPSWERLGQQRAAVIEAVRRGLGLLLRVSAAPSAALLDDLAKHGLGLSLDASDPIELQAMEGLPRLAPGTALHAWAMQASGDHAVELAAGTAGSHGAWTTLGRGRIGASWLLDGYQWAQQGMRVHHASHWAELWSTLARPHAVPTRSWTHAAPAVAGQRLVLCGGDGKATLHGPQGQRLVLLRDPLAGDCTAAWPDTPGRWQLGSESESAESTASQWIDVFDVGELSTLLQAQRREATAARAAIQPPDRSPSAPLAVDPRDWRSLLLASWLLLAALAWMLERREVGRAAS